jgi:antitoxin component HigA of HigAB toxin-antitoxin module
MKFLIMKQSDINAYLHGDSHGDPNLVCTDVYSLYDISCVRISDTLYNSLRPLFRTKAQEISEEVAYYGAGLFGDIRPIAKIWEAGQDHYSKVKVPIEVTPEIAAMVTEFMYKFAKAIIESEFDRRFDELADSSKTEITSWEIQKHEAKEYLDNPETAITPFLDYIAIERGFEKAELANKILEKSEKWYDDLSTQLVTFQKLIKEFQAARTIWNMNLLYEKYFGILMPNAQAIELGLQDPDTWERAIEVKVNEFGF